MSESFYYFLKALYPRFYGPTGIIFAQFMTALYGTWLWFVGKYDMKNMTDIITGLYILEVCNFIFERYSLSSTMARSVQWLSDSLSTLRTSGSIPTRNKYGVCAGNMYVFKLHPQNWGNLSEGM